MEDVCVRVAEGTAKISRTRVIPQTRCLQVGQVLEL